MARKQSQSGYSFRALLDSVTDLGLKLSALVFLVVLGYLIYGLVSGLPKYSSMDHANRVRVIENISLACRILGVSGLIVSLCLAIRFYAEETLGYLMSLLGVFLYFGTPWLLSVVLADTALKANRPVGIIADASQSLAIWFFVPGVIIILRDVVLRINGSLVSRRVRARREETSSFIVGEISDESTNSDRRPSSCYAKCWQMHYCRDFVKPFCPAFSKKKACWKLKSGCFCDEKTMLQAMMVKDKRGEAFAKERKYQSGSSLPKSRLTPTQKRDLCRNCVIYQFHQQQKYKLASPLVFPTVAILIYYYYPAIQGLFKSTVLFMDKFVSKVSFMPQAQHAVHQPAPVPEYILWAGVAWAGIVGISYGLRLIEFLVFKLQI